MKTNPHPEPPRVLFLFSDTGGGHRSATEAIIEAVDLEFGGLISTQMVDIFLECAPMPLNHLPALYPKIVRYQTAWGLGYRWSNHNLGARWINTGAWPYVRRSIKRMIAQYQSDLIVSLHPLANWPMLRALGDDRSPFITVVTDLVTTHALWYHPKADLCLVPTEEAYERALKSGMEKNQVRVVGLPVREGFYRSSENKEMIRSRYGWPKAKPLILLVGGGEGMGYLGDIAREIASTCSSACLVVVCGRNQALKQQFLSQEWPIQVHVYGFIHEMSDYMHAADMLVTKAGPGTISEALNAGLPMILYNRLPGQEDGNVTYLVSEGAGVWAPTLEMVSAAVKYWLNHPTKYHEAVSTCQRLARPQAARQIARILAGYLEKRVEIR